MTDDLDRLLELAGKATPGPWQGNAEMVYNPDHWFQTKDGDYDKGAIVAAKFDTKADAEYIAAASPDVVRGLIERVKEAEKYPGATRGAAAVIDHATKRIEDLEAKLRAAEEVVRATKAHKCAGYFQENPEDLAYALQHYDKAVGRVKE